MELETQRSFKILAMYQFEPSRQLVFPIRIQSTSKPYRRESEVEGGVHIYTYTRRDKYQNLQTRNFKCSSILTLQCIVGYTPWKPWKERAKCKHILLTTEPHDELHPAADLDGAESVDEEGEGEYVCRPAN